MIDFLKGQRKQIHNQRKFADAGLRRVGARGIAESESLLALEKL